MAQKLLIRDDGVIFGWDPRLEKHPRMRPYTPPEQEKVEAEVAKEKLPPIPPLPSREILMQYIRDNFGVEPNKTRSITEYRKLIDKYAKRQNKEF